MSRGHDKANPSRQIALSRRLHVIPSMATGHLPTCSLGIYRQAPHQALRAGLMARRHIEEQTKKRVSCLFSLLLFPLCRPRRSGACKGRWAIVLVPSFYLFLLPCLRSAGPRRLPTFTTVRLGLDVECRATCEIGGGARLCHSARVRTGGKTHAPSEALQAGAHST